MHWLDIAIIAAFIVYAIGSGIRSSGVASRNVEEYFLAGRSLRGWQAGLSMAATQFAADTPLLVMGIVATAGIFALWRLWIYALAFLLVGFVLAGSWRRAKVITDAELTEFRYGGKAAAALRGIKAIYFGTIFNCTVLAMVLLAATRVAEPFLTWDQWLSPTLYDPIRTVVHWIGTPITIVNPEAPGVQARLNDPNSAIWINSTNNLISIGSIVLVTLFYSTTGGLRSVVATDIVQFFLMMLATALFAGFVVSKAGGMSAIIDTIRERFADGGPAGMTPDQLLAFTPSRAKDAGLALLAVFSMQWLLQIYADGTGYLAQRTMACRSARDAKVATLVLAIVQVLIRSLFWLPIALGLLVLFPPNLEQPLIMLEAEREATYIQGIAELLPIGLKGLMLTGMLAALASTVDTHLNWGASYWTNDLYERFYCRRFLKRKADPRTSVWVARVSYLGILGIAVLIMSQLSSIQTAWKASLLLGAGLGVILVLRWIWWRINAWGELATLFASIVLAPTLMLLVESDAWRLLLMALGATTAGIVVSLVVGPEDKDHLIAFYCRARPPGFWGPVAADQGDDPKAGPRRLGRSVLGMVTAALSIFCLLVGVGSWMCGSPPPVWFPWRGVWIALNLVVGLALIPVWWWLGFAEEEPTDLPVSRLEKIEAELS